MAKKRPQRQSKVLSSRSLAPDRNAELPGSDESKRSVAVTVAWTMAALATFFAEFAGVLAHVIRFCGGNPDLCQIAAYLMLWVSVFSGGATLLLTPLALRLRDTPPPRGVTIAIIVIGTLPLVALVALNR